MFDPTPHVSFDTVMAVLIIVGALILVSIWLSTYVIRREHADILKELRRNTGETVLSKTNAFRAANTADRNADAITAAATDIVTQVTTVASEVAERLAGQTPVTGTRVPNELRLIVSAETERPHIVTAK